MADETTQTTQDTVNPSDDSSAKKPKGPSVSEQLAKALRENKELQNLNAQFADQLDDLSQQIKSLREQLEGGTTGGADTLMAEAKHLLNQAIFGHKSRELVLQIQAFLEK